MIFQPKSRTKETKRNNLELLADPLANPDSITSKYIPTDLKIKKMQQKDIMKELVSTLSQQQTLHRGHANMVTANLGYSKVYTTTKHGNERKKTMTACPL